MHGYKQEKKISYFIINFTKLSPCPYSTVLLSNCLEKCMQTKHFLNKKIKVGLL